jgi:hypothetical protein
MSPPRDLGYQIRMHAQALQRWLSPAEAKARATQSVKARTCWWWPEPIASQGQQQDLFKHQP